MRRRLPRLLGVLLLTVTGGCLTVHHTVGAGPTGGETAAAHAWYALWGFVPLGGTRDVRTLAGERVNYRVTTGMETWDVLLNLPLLPLGFLRTTLRVEF